MTVVAWRIDWLQVKASGGEDLEFRFCFSMIRDIVSGNGK